MIRRRNTTSLHRAAAPAGEDINPNAYITNIADCMLVLVLGLLVALVMRYGLELTDPVPEDKIIGIEMDMDQNGDGVIDDNFTESGKVYQDSTTGNYYMVSE